MNHHRSLALLLLLLVASTSHPQTPTPKPTPSDRKLSNIVERVKSRLNFSLETVKFPGAQVGFVYVDGQTPDGKPRYVTGSVAVGVSDRQTGAKLKTTDRLL